MIVTPTFPSRQTLTFLNRPLNQKEIQTMSPVKPRQGQHHTVDGFCSLDTQISQNDNELRKDKRKP